jgi:tetratricopeptide (TPR) repeat protein
MSGVKWMLALIGLLAVVAGGFVIFQRVDRDRQYRHLLDEGEQALQTGNVYRAIEDFSGALALRPDSMVAYYRRGEAYHADHHDDWAIRDLREASRLAPDSAQPLIALGEVYDSRNDPLEAARWYGEAADRLRDADPALLYALALARYRAGSPGAAIEPLRRAIDRNDSVGQTYYLLGLVYRDTNRVEDAIDALQRAIKVAPSLAPAREELADLYRSQGRLVDEMAVLQELAALDRNDDRRVAIAMAAMRRGQFDSALAALDDVPAGGHDSEQVEVARARILLERSERTFDPQWARQAQAALERALAGGARRSETLALLGRALFLSGDPAAAERTLTEAIALSPVAPEAFEYLADASERLTHITTARDALVSLDALEGDTSAGAVRSARARRIGVLALKAGDPRQAADYLEQAVAAGDSDVSTLGLLADACWQSGKTDVAKSTLARALGRDPHNADLQRLSRTIK